MQLSLEIIKQNLEKEYSVNSYGAAHTELTLDRPKYYYPGIHISENGFYIIDTAAIETEEWDGCFVICAGKPELLPEFDSFHLLVVEDANPGEVINSVNDTFGFYDEWDPSPKTPGKTGAGYLHAVLDGDDPESIDLMKALGKYQWKRDDTYVCLKFSSDGLTPPERHYVCREFEKRYEGTCVVEFYENIIVVANLSLAGKTLEALVSDIEPFANEGHYVLGASAVFYDIFDLKWRYLQAGIALEAGASAGPPNWLYHFDSVRLKYLMGKCAEELGPKFICDSELLRLKHIDAETGTNYFISLSLYLKNCRNAVQTAEALSIHRLTLIYRLNRIKEITALKWDAPEDYFLLLLSVNILENNKA